MVGFLSHLLLEGQFANYLWDRWRRSFGVSGACNMDGSCLFEEVLLHFLLREKDKAF